MKLIQVIFVMISVWHVVYATRSEHEQFLLDIYTSKKIIKQMHDEVVDLSSHDDSQKQEEFVIEILTILMSTYEKMIGLTVSYYLMMHNPYMQQKIKDEIATMLSQDVIKILSIVSKQALYYMFDEDVTLQEKLWYCGAIISMIIVMKLGIDQIPPSMKLQKNQQEHVDKTSYLTDKFALYR